jgi:hypothetical protein
MKACSGPGRGRTERFSSILAESPKKTLLSRLLKGQEQEISNFLSSGDKTGKNGDVIRFF